jgi:hypothetical protein
VRASEVIASDETSARVKGKTHWQWAFGCATAVYHVIAPTRGKCVPTDFLAGVRPKVWLSDRLPAQCTHAEAHHSGHAGLQHRRCFDDDGRMTDDTLLPFDLPAVRRKKLTSISKAAINNGATASSTSRAEPTNHSRSTPEVSAAAWIMASLRRKRR